MLIGGWIRPAKIAVTELDCHTAQPETPDHSIIRVLAAFAPELPPSHPAAIKPIACLLSILVGGEQVPSFPYAAFAQRPKRAVKRAGEIEPRAVVISVVAFQLVNGETLRVPYDSRQRGVAVAGNLERTLLMKRPNSGPDTIRRKYAR